MHFEGYQVSNQCMALVRDECLLPCKDAPELGFAKESSPEQYVPDVFFKVQRSFSEAGCFEADAQSSDPLSVFIFLPSQRTKTNLGTMSHF